MAEGGTPEEDETLDMHADTKKEHFGALQKTSHEARRIRALASFE